MMAFFMLIEYGKIFWFGIIEFVPMNAIILIAVRKREREKAMKKYERLQS
jgi:hypothetical protein